VISNLASPNRTVFMRLTVNTSSESGLIGLAFHPATRPIATSTSFIHWT